MGQQNNMIINYMHAKCHESRACGCFKNASKFGNISIVIQFATSHYEINVDNINTFKFQQLMKKTTGQGDSTRGNLTLLRL